MTAGKPDFWTLPQAIAWICVGNAFADGKLRGPATSDQLKILSLLYQSKRQLKVRATFTRPQIKWARAGLPLIIPEALMQLEAWAVTGLVAMRAKDPATGKVRAGSPEFGCKLLIPPYSPGDLFGFWDERKHKWDWLDPEFSASDIKKHSPQRLSKSFQKKQIEAQVKERLAELAHERGTIKLSTALMECLQIDGCKRETVRNAWKKFPAKHKLKAGRPSNNPPK